MFTYDQQRRELSDSSDYESAFVGRPRSKKRKQRSAADSVLLSAHFPEARQIMFIPIWDSTTSRAAACFVYNCSEYRNFTHQLEFLNCITFNNCVDTELLRLSNLKATEQKNDFIGSISHELRSPLHGILASCEFLQDTTCTSFQQSLVKTAESCAKTLLDTVNMVLDYSKINAFEKDKSTGATPNLTNGETKHRKTFQTDLNAHRNVNLATLTEEVVEGVATGHVFNDPHIQTGRPEATPNSRSSDDSQARCRPDVALIIDISEQDWTYWCEPGSIRRIVMNLVGNALKYTRTGFIHVKLDTQTAEEDATTWVVLTVTDSGQGISPAYLKDKLYKPFAQESNQAPGVGLGLSLVKLIVDNMGGHIDVDSTVGIGTKFAVKFPVTRQRSSDRGVEEGAEPAPSEARAVMHNHASSKQKTGLRAGGASVAVYWSEDEGAMTNQQEACRLLRRTLTSCLSAWSSKPVGKWQEQSTADIVVVEESAFDELIRCSPLLATPDCPTMILVLLNTGSADLRARKNVEVIRHPIGPHKLARALQACVNRSKAGPRKSTGLTVPIESITSATVQLSISVNQTPYQGALAEKINDISKDEPVNGLKAVPAPTTCIEVLNTAPKSITVTISDLASPSRRILLVDDNAINLRLLQVGMKKRGYTSISSAADGLQAVNTYCTLLHSSPPAPPDIILMDLSMPVMNGFDATRKIREIEAEYNSELAPSQAPHHSVIVALTGLASVRDQKQAYIAGVDFYVMKPVSFAKLAKLLEGWTAGTGAIIGDVPDSTVSLQPAMAADV